MEIEKLHTKKKMLSEIFDKFYQLTNGIKM